MAKEPKDYTYKVSFKSDSPKKEINTVIRGLRSSLKDIKARNISVQAVEELESEDSAASEQIA